MPPKRAADGSIVQLRVKTPRKDLVLPNNIVDWNCHVAYFLNGLNVSFGYLKQEVAMQLTKESYRGLCKRKANHSFQENEVQATLLLCSLPPPLKRAPLRDGSEYLKATRGQCVMPDLELRLRKRLARCHHCATTTQQICKMLDDTSTIREKDNLFHLYALFTQYPGLSGLMERTFLWIVTDSGPRNKHGVMITIHHINKLCDLLNAEGAYGLPVLEGKGSTIPRYNRLDLSHLIADLIDVLRVQNMTGNFVRPLLPSILYEGVSNPIKPRLGKLYGIEHLTNPHYS